MACSRPGIRGLWYLTEFFTLHSTFPRFCVWLFALDRYVSHKALICIHLRRCVYKTPARIHRCLSMRVHVHCFLPNRTTAIVRPTLRRTPAFIRGADSPASDDGQHGECNIQQYQRCSLLLDFSVSSDMQPLYRWGGKKASSYLSRVFSLFLDVPVSFAALSLSSISFSESLPLALLPLVTLYCMSPSSSFDGDEDGCRTEAVYCLRGFAPTKCVRRCNYCKLSP